MRAPTTRRSTRPRRCVAALEGGAAALLFASGMAAATAVFQALAPGDHVLAPKVMYWSLRNWLMTFATRWGLEVEFIDMTDPAAVRGRAAARPARGWCGSRRRPIRCGP